MAGIRATEVAMTFAQLLHRFLDFYFGDAAFERRDRQQVEKIKEGPWDEVFKEAWTEVPEELRLRVTDDGRERIRQRFLNRRRAEWPLRPPRGNDATAAG